ncbi:hypothetical protein A9R05_43140 (plasmid) [Burkholderia sp. KK1]|uniref:Uncharacterized protein n=1 Tax=Burkholderia sp. M701 TaxID=326454 RepID=V5YN85_9BURK|nr:hypothetical protein [Burkholderia sp. M701]AQH05812.1 hypothetical protein A9R05_43140 [Burkholderia sp. KK1]BAO19035.1 hypothetical protein [Burkholderia sp. M701]
MDISSLERGKRYTFHIKPFEPAEGDPIAVEPKTRQFVGPRDIGANGMPSTPFVEVARDDGTCHLLALDTISRVELT